MSAIMMTLREALRGIPEGVLVGDGDSAVLRVHTDTRTIEPGDLFVALKGERFDANTLLEQARQSGAVAVVCNAGLDSALYPAGLPRIEVPDTLKALQALATYWRSRFALPVIAVTGSNGKTTVTQMIASVLQAQCGVEDALATRGNLNNDIGVPLTLLRLRAHHRMAVVEMGMNHPGEIALLARMVQPTVALVNNAQREHLEFMQTVQAVAEENGSVISFLGPQGTAVFPADDAYTSLWRTLAGARKIAQFADANVGANLVANAGAADCLVAVHAQWAEGGWSVKAQGLGVALQYQLTIAGRHNVKNSLAAAACALAAGVAPSAVEQGLEAFRPVKGRSRATSVSVNGQSRTVVDDTYNANPDSVRAAIDVLAELPGPRLLVLGDMGEVGTSGPEFHAEAGRYAKARGIEHLMALGTLTQHSVAEFATAQHFDAVEGLNAAVVGAMPAVASVLVKGSRFMRMERVVEALNTHYSNGASGCC